MVLCVPALPAAPPRALPPGQEVGANHQVEPLHDNLAPERVSQEGRHFLWVHNDVLDGDAVHEKGDHVFDGPDLSDALDSRLRPVLVNLREVCQPHVALALVLLVGLLHESSIPLREERGNVEVLKLL